MTESRGFTQMFDWLAFMLPNVKVEEVVKIIGGDWLPSETGFRGYPTAHLMTEGKNGVGKLGTGAPRNPKEVHVDLSAGIVSQCDAPGRITFRALQIQGAVPPFAFTASCVTAGTHGSPRAVMKF